MAYTGYDTKVTSEWNDAGLQIRRLNNIWIECKYNREKGKLIDYKWKLDSAAVELWNDAKRLDKEETNGYTTTLQELDKEIIKAELEKNLSLFYQKLLAKERILREVQELSGKGSKFKAADEDFM